MANMMFKAMVSGLLMAGALAGMPSLAAAQQDPAMVPETSPGAIAPPARPFFGGVGLAKGTGKIVPLPHPAASIFAADPDVVEVRPASPTSLFVFAKGLGSTTVAATDANGNVIAQYTVTVGPSNYAANRLSNESQLSAPGESVQAESEPGGMIVRGAVQTPDEANQVINQAKLIAPGGNVLNDLQVREPVQVMLKVRIASMSRSTTRELGIDWGAATSGAIQIGRTFITGGIASLTNAVTSPAFSAASSISFPGGSLEGIIDALASDNLAHIMAEPTLTTLSGTQANFLVGGEFPIPISESNGEATIEFKTYGVQLQFTPTVFSDGRIALQVTPQVSQISNANSVTLASAGGSTSAIVVPALTVQGASSTVILGSGQGMAIAGLLQDTSNQTDNAVPGLGEVPVLGALFRGDNFARTQQELVITVTPYLVTPQSDPAALTTPDNGWTPPNDLERIFLLRDSGTKPARSLLPEDAGFMVQ